MPLFISPLFGTPPGVVGVADLTQTIPVAIAIGGGGIPTVPILDPPRFFSIITGFDLQAQSGMAVTHTLNDAVRVYLFGERVHAARVSGFAFGWPCGTPPFGSFTGIDRVWRYYQYFRASSYLAPIRIFAGQGALVIGGMMSGLTLSVQDTTFGAAQFAFDFVALPPVFRRIRFPAFGPGAVFAQATPASRPEIKDVGSILKKGDDAILKYDPPEVFQRGRGGVTV